MDFGPGFYLALSPKDAIQFGTFLHKARVKLEKPVVVGEGYDPELVAWFKKALRITEDDLSEYDNPVVGVFDLFGALVESGLHKPSALVSALKKKGYDGVYVENSAIEQTGMSGVENDYVVVWEPDQILEWELVPLAENAEIYRSTLRRNSTPEEDARYRALLRQQYKPRFVRHIVSGEESTLALLGMSAEDVQAMESSGGTIVRYVRKQLPGTDRHFVFLLAMISPLRKITKKEVETLRSWVTTLEESIATGDIVVTSVNSKTRRIFANAIARVRSYGYKVVIDALPMPPTEYGGDTWETVMVYSGERMDPMQLMMMIAGQSMQPNRRRTPSW